LQSAQANQSQIPSLNIPGVATLADLIQEAAKTSGVGVPNAVDCINAALGISTHSTSTSSASWFTETFQSAVFRIGLCF
jgi:hypothetical protein